MAKVSHKWHLTEKIQSAVEAKDLGSSFASAIVCHVTLDNVCQGSVPGLFFFLAEMETGKAWGPGQRKELQNLKV